MSFKRHRLLYAGFILILLGFVTTAGYFYLRTQDLSNVEVVKQRISTHYVLPSNEQPALVTVTDTTKLTSEFLKQTKNGDKVLIYQSNRKAIIYRPDIDRVIDVAPVVIDTLPTIDN